MADVENQQDSSFPVKRKSDLFCQDQDNLSNNKSQKLNPESTDGGENNGSGIEDLDSIGAESSVCPEKPAEKVENNGVIGDLLEAEEEQQVGDEEEEDDEEEDEEEVEEVVDRKGKGISREDKGKGKLIEVDSSDDEEDDSDDDDDEGFGEDDESDFSDDPLAEVDLDNILPSRTRRRSSQPGVYISNDVTNRGDDDDSSDDSDA